jgi:cytochrome c oxidase subunit 2
MKKTFLASLALLLFFIPYRTGAQSEPKTIAITAHRFTFEPNQITLKKGESVTLQLTTSDVTHGFYLKPLKIDEVIEPGKTTNVTVTPQTAGMFTTICDHFCGTNHGNMKMTIVVTE